MVATLNKETVLLREAYVGDGNLNEFIVQLRVVSLHHCLSGQSSALVTFNDNFHGTVIVVRAHFMVGPAFTCIKVPFKRNLLLHQSELSSIAGLSGAIVVESREGQLFHFNLIQF